MHRVGLEGNRGPSRSIPILERKVNMAYEQNMNQMSWQQQPMQQNQYQQQSQVQQNQYQQMPLQTYTYENIPEANIQNWAIAPGSRIVFLNQNEGKIIVKSFPYGSQQVIMKTYVDELSMVPTQLEQTNIDIPQNVRDDIDYLKKEVRRLNNLVNKNKPKEA